MSMLTETIDKEARMAISDDVTAPEPLNCPYCGFIHNDPCPRVSEIEYNPDGSVKNVVLGSAGHLHVKSGM